MAKKQILQHKKLSFKDILKGKFLVEANAFSNWKFIVYVVFLVFIMISSSHSIDNKTIKIGKLKNDVNEMKAKYAFINSKLMNLRLESQLINQVERDSLLPLEDHPFKILVQNK